MEFLLPYMYYIKYVYKTIGFANFCLIFRAFRAKYKKYDRNSIGCSLTRIYIYKTVLACGYNNILSLTFYRGYMLLGRIGQRPPKHLYICGIQNQSFVSFFRCIILYGFYLHICCKGHCKF